jgi:hypothetical protein
MADNAPKLGALITGEAERDAVHVAVVPMLAHRTLTAGEHIGVSKADTGVSADLGPMCDDLIGIVDPFLRVKVKPNEQFYLFLYPGTVISLRHHYRHPVLDHEEIRRETLEALNAPAVQRMRQWAASFGITYREALQHTELYLLTGKGAVLDGLNGGMNASTDDYPDGGTFWGDYEQLTMRKVPDEQKKDFFSCSC